MRSDLVLAAAGIAFATVVVLLVASTLGEPAVETFSLTDRGPAEAGTGLTGPVRVTLDASNPGAWTFFDFSRGAVVEGLGADWDLAFRRSDVIVNGGEGFPGRGGVLDLGEVPFDSVRLVPAGGYATTRANRDSVLVPFEDWYRYSFTSHLLTPRPRTYAVRTADGRYAKLRMRGFYCPGPVPACMTFEYVYQGGGGRRVAP